MRIIFRSLLLLIVSLVAIIIFVIATSWGTQEIYYAATKLLPGRLSIQKINGTVISGLTLEKINYQYRIVDISADSATFKINLHSLRDAKAKLIIESISGRVNNLDLSGNAEFTLHRNHVALDNVHIKLGDARLDASGTLDRKLAFKWQLQIPDLGAVLPGSTGIINSTGNISGTAKIPVINADIDIRHFTYDDLSIAAIKIHSQQVNTTILASDINYDDVILRKATIHLVSNITQKSINTQVDGTLDQHSEIKGQIITDRDQSIDANLHLYARDISTLPFSIPDVSQLAGQFRASFTMHGGLRQPQWQLEGEVQHGQAYIPTIGMQLKNISATADFQNDKPLTFTGQVYAGNGKADVNGKLVLTADNYDFTLSAKGTNLQIINTHEFNVIASPDLTMHYTNEGATITGTVSIPEASITPTDFNDVISIPDETIFSNQKKSETDFYKHLTLDIESHLGDAIKVKYDKLQANLQGNLRILKSSGSLPTAIGELSTAKGSYTAYGQKLKITTGRLIYAGNLITNPGIDVSATKKVKPPLTSADSQFNNGDVTPEYIGDTITIGILVRGTVDSPVITFFSEPAGVSQNDILSYLLFGYPHSQITTASGLALLNSAANSMHPEKNKAGIVTDKIQKTLGLSELGVSNAEYYDPVSSKNGSTSAVNVGKKLGKNLSIHYTLGLFYPVSILNLRYKLNKHVILQTETSTVETGADVIYSIERE